MPIVGVDGPPATVAARRNRQSSPAEGGSAPRLAARGSWHCEPGGLGCLTQGHGAPAMCIRGSMLTSTCAFAMSAALSIDAHQAVNHPAPAVECRSSLAGVRQHAGVVKLVNTADLKSAGASLTGSSPVLGTNKIKDIMRCCAKRERAFYVFLQHTFGFRPVLLAAIGQRSAAQTSRT